MDEKLVDVENTDNTESLPKKKKNKNKTEGKFWINFPFFCVCTIKKFFPNSNGSKVVRDWKHWQHRMSIKEEEKEEEKVKR